MKSITVFFKLLIIEVKNRLTTNPILAKRIRILLYVTLLGFIVYANRQIIFLNFQIEKYYNQYPQASQPDVIRLYTRELMKAITSTCVYVIIPFYEYFFVLRQSNNQFVRSIYLLIFFNSIFFFISLLSFN